MGTRRPTPLWPTPKIRILIVTLLCLTIKTNISIFGVRPWIHSFRQMSALCWHNCYSFGWPLLPWVSLKHGQRYPRLFKDWRKATWPCIIWLRQLCSGLSHLNYNHKKEMYQPSRTQSYGQEHETRFPKPALGCCQRQAAFSAGSHGPLRRQLASHNYLSLRSLLKSCPFKPPREKDVLGS